MGSLEEERAKPYLPYLERTVSTARRPAIEARKYYTSLSDGILHLNLGPPRSKLFSMQVIGAFEYPPLPGPDYIRLLHLEPTSDDPLELRGQLKVHKLDAHCEYEAISYAWGDFPKCDRPLFLNNQVLKITLNLYAALMAYSYPDRTRVLWADAICINQADNVEKGHQVAIMSDIYSKAQTVQIWLTLASKAATEAMKFMEDLSLQAESFGISGVDQPRLPPDLPTVTVSSRKARDLIDDAIKAHVDYLISRSWFNRVWIVQELTLAVKLVVSCGQSRMNWTPFAQALEILRGAFRKVPQGKARWRMSWVKPAWGLVHLRDAFRLLDQHGTRDHHAMTNLVGRQMSNKACTDDRDRVYAMLAMTKSPYAMTPDYEKTVAEAYTEFTQRYSPNTQIYWAGLCRRQPRPSSENVDAGTKSNEPQVIDLSDRVFLPSWVPEFRPSLNLAWASPFNGTYNVAKGAPYWFLSHPFIPSAMCVTGTIFDVIGYTTWAYRPNSAPYCKTEPGFYFSVMNQLQAIPCFTSKSGPLSGGVEIVTLDQSSQRKFEPTSEPLWLILAKTLTGGVGDCPGAGDMLSMYSMFESLQHLNPGSLAWLTAIWDCFAKHCLAPTGEVFQHVLLKTLGAKAKPLNEEARIAQGFLTHLANILVPNRLFITVDGHIGLAPRDVRGGDIVAILNGCHMPYVVRSAGKVKFKEEPLKGALQVIGPCYLHGIMNGEIFKNRDAPQFSKLEWTRHDGDSIDALEGWMMLI